MGFCGTGRCGPRCAGWVGPTALLCFYGFCSTMRPIEPFMAEFLTGTYKNLTTEQVSRQVYPVWTYSSAVLLVPVLLVTDAVRYKPVIILQALAFITAFLLLTLGPGVGSAQSAFFFYSVAMASDVAYFSYIYTVVPSVYYQRVTGYVRGAVLLGNAGGSLLGQLLVSLAQASSLWLASLTVISLTVALVISCFLPMPQSSSPGPYCAHQGGAQDSRGCFVAAVQPAVMMVRRLASDCRRCYSSLAVVFFCVWAAAGRCGFYQVVGYVQVLWVHVQPRNSTAYNGGVDAISTLAGAAGAVAVGHVPLDWSVWGELVLGGFTFLISAALFLMDWTDSIWISYSCFFLFKTLYMPLAAICSFQIAQTLARRRFALVFGVNSLAGTVLQSVLTAIVINGESLQLSIASQFFIYSGFFAAIALLFTVRGVFTALHMKRLAGGVQTESAADLPEASPL